MHGFLRNDPHLQAAQEKSKHGEAIEHLAKLFEALHQEIRGDDALPAVKITCPDSGIIFEPINADKAPTNADISGNVLLRDFVRANKKLFSHDELRHHMDRSSNQPPHHRNDEDPEGFAEVLHAISQSLHGAAEAIQAESPAISRDPSIDEDHAERLRQPLLHLYVHLIGDAFEAKLMPTDELVDWFKARH